MRLFFILFLSLFLSTACTNVGQKPGGNGEAVNGFLPLASNHIRITQEANLLVTVSGDEQAVEGAGFKTFLTAYQLSSAELGTLNNDSNNQSVSGVYRACHEVTAGDPFHFQFQTNTQDPVLLVSSPVCPSLTPGQADEVTLLKNNAGLSNFVIKTLLSINDKPETTIIGSHWDGASLYVNTNKGVYRSEDFGTSFSPLGSNPYFFSTQLLSCSHRGSYFAVEPSGKTTYTVDAGLSFHSGHVGLPPAGKYWGGCTVVENRVALWSYDQNSPPNPAPDVLLISHDGGISFQTISLPSHTRYLVSAHVDGQEITLALFNGISISNDGGQNFGPLINPVIDGKEVFHATDPVSVVQEVQNQARTNHPFELLALMSTIRIPKGLYRKGNFIVLATGDKLLFSYNQGQSFSVLDQIEGYMHFAKQIIVANDTLFAIGHTKIIRVFGVVPH